MREYKRLSKESRMIEKRSRSRAIAIAKAKDRAKRRARMQSMSKTQSQSKSQSQTRSKTKTSTDRKTRTHKFGWKSGDGTSSREILVHRNARNRSHCVSLVRVNHPKANGATLQSKGRGRCYAEFNMKGRNNSRAWISTYIEPRNDLKKKYYKLFKKYTTFAANLRLEARKTRDKRNRNILINSAIKYNKLAKEYLEKSNKL